MSRAGLSELTAFIAHTPTLACQALVPTKRLLEQRHQLDDPAMHGRMDETYIKVKGQWRYLYRAVEKAGDTIDFLFRAKRDKVVARRFLQKAMAQNGTPETVTINRSGSNLAALHAINAKRETPIKVRQVKYLNNIVEQDHRTIKRITRPMLGFKDFDCARVILSGIELMHMIKKEQMKCSGKVPLSAAQQFYSLVS